ncbi:KH domain-containing protein HEN4 [Bienertia sinuspersici]
MQGKPMILKKALYEVSTLLHENPRKEKALNFAPPSRGPEFHAMGPPLPNLPPSRGVDPMWSPRDPSRHMPPPPWMDDYRRNSGLNPAAFEEDLTRAGVEPSGEFSMKILCLVSKIGGVIGKGGINVRQLQQDTGTTIHVEDASAHSEERVIRVSAFETLRNQRSQTIDAILLLQTKVSEVSEKGIITTRLLVPYNKVGCLLGQGGAVINEMRKRTQADIRVYSKDEKPECALEDEELVQVSGSFAVAKDALAEIASRLRARTLRDGSAAAEPVPPPPRPVQGYGPTGGFPRGPPPVPGPVEMGSSGSYNPVKAPGMRPKHHDPYRSESMADIRGGSDRYPAAPANYNSYSGPNNPHPGSYPDLKGQGSYHNSMPPQQTAYQSPYQNHQLPYQQSNAQQSPYRNMNTQHSAYQSVAAHGSYQY